MSFKVVRDSLGAVICFGPNDDNYEPSQSYAIEETQPVWGATPVDVAAQIAALEREQLMPRATREFMLMFMEANATAEVLALNPGYQAVKAFDNQIAALRAQLP